MKRMVSDPTQCQSPFDRFSAVMFQPFNPLLLHTSCVFNERFPPFNLFSRKHSSLIPQVSIHIHPINEHTAPTTDPPSKRTPIGLT